MLFSCPRLGHGSRESRVGGPIRGPAALMHLGRKNGALYAPLLVSPFVSRGAPRPAT
jgi:hypothetical protein